jgi:hypothetical protein
VKDTRVFQGDEFVVNERTFTLDYLQENINIGPEFATCEHSCMCPQEIKAGKYSTVSFEGRKLL